MCVIRCKLCYDDATNEKWYLCYNCWKMFGKPKDNEEILNYLKDHPDLLSALTRKFYRGLPEQ
jgi:hypothetical protein